MKYVSTRGQAPVLEFGDVLLAGLARDGGLYVPETYPSLGPLERFLGAPYEVVATEVMWPYVEGAIDRDLFAELVADSYRGFRHAATCPLVQLDDDLWLLELFHGPTLAFKDVALQLVGRLFDAELTRRGERVVIVGATSGDTGSAAIEACRDRANVDIVILHPAGRVSEVQRRQMTTVASPNVHNVAIEGTFDDCQDLVKAMFADEAFRDRLHLSAVNSINWARVMAQVVYYVTAGVALGAPARPITFSVPTGNFGNVLAGWVAGRMGLPLGELLIGCNRNDILARFFATGDMAMAEVHPTLSPSMDIQVSSNFERALFEVNDRDGGLTAEQMQRFRATGRLQVEPDQKAELDRVFRAATVDDDGTRAVIASVFAATGELVDPHTAVGIGAARALARPGQPVVALGCAHPAKFPDAVEAATGVRPPLPAHLATLLEGVEQFVQLPNDLAVLQRHVEAVTTA